MFECDSFAERGVKTIHLCSTDTVCCLQAHFSRLNVGIIEKTCFSVSKNHHKLLFFQTSLQLSIFLWVSCVFVCFLENTWHKRSTTRSPEQRLRLTEMNSLCRYITWCMNNEQKNTKVLSVCLQIQFRLSIFIAWAFDQNCLIKPHSSKRTGYLGTLSVLSTPQKTYQLHNIPMKAGTDQGTEKIYTLWVLWGMQQRVRSDPARLINSAWLPAMAELHRFALCLNAKWHQPYPCKHPVQLRFQAEVTEWGQGPARRGSELQLLALGLQITKHY